LDSNLKAVKKANPERIILGTPEAFVTFSKEKDFVKISTLPDELLKKFKTKKDFSTLKMTVAIHKACQMENDPFYEPTKSLLKLIPGISIVELKDKCGQMGFDGLDSKSKQNTLKLLSKAVKNDVDAIVCTSPYCESHMQLCLREGSWRTTDIKITDVYRLLFTSLEGGDI
jgi:Fe-S oxidoreductase